MALIDDCEAVMVDPDVHARYRSAGGLTAADILIEIRNKFGQDAYPLVSILDVIDEMHKLYGRNHEDD